MANVPAVWRVGGWEEPAAVGGDQPFGLIYQAHYGVVYSESLECGGCLVGVRRVSTGFLHDDGDLARGRVKPIHWFRRGVAGVGQELLGCGVWGCDEPWRVYDSNGNGFGEVFKNGVAAGVNVGGFANDESGAGQVRYWVEFIVDPNVELTAFCLDNGRIAGVDGGFEYCHGKGAKAYEYGGGETEDVCPVAGGEWVVDHADVAEDESVFQASGEEFMPRYLGFSGGCDAHVGLPWV